MKKILISVFIILLISGTAFWGFNNSKKPPAFEFKTVEKGNITENITASGTVNPVTNISVGTQVSGTIKGIYADFNSPVKKGQILAQIDPSLFEGQVEQANANVFNAQANLNKIKSIIANDEKSYKRTKQLYESNYIAKSELDLAESIYNSDKAQIQSAYAQIAQAKAALKNNLTNLKYTKIISPVNGIVVSRNVDVGQTVAASFQTPTLFLVAQDLTKMQIDTNVAEADIGKVKVGQAVEYTLDGYPDVTFNGKVKQIRISPTTVQNVVTYNVVINVDNKDLKLKPGMTANVSIITSQKKNILMLPNAALRFTMNKGEDAPKFKTTGVWVLDEEGKPARIAVKTGLNDGQFAEILSGSLKEGQKIIVDTIEKDNKRNMRQPGPRMF